MFFVKNTLFLEGVHLGQKKHLFVRKNNTFLCVYPFFSLGGINCGQKTRSFVIKNNIFACPRVPSSLKVSILVKKSIYF